MVLRICEKFGCWERVDFSLDLWVLYNIIYIILYNSVNYLISNFTLSKIQNQLLQYIIGIKEPNRLIHSLKADLLSGHKQRGFVFSKGLRFWW